MRFFKKLESSIYENHREIVNNKYETTKAINGISERFSRAYDRINELEDRINDIVLAIDFISNDATVEQVIAELHEQRGSKLSGNCLRYFVMLKSAINKEKLHD